MIIIIINVIDLICIKFYYDGSILTLTVENHIEYGV